MAGIRKFLETSMQLSGTRFKLGSIFSDEELNTIFPNGVEGLSSEAIRSSLEMHLASADGGEKEGFLHHLIGLESKIKDMDAKAAAAQQEQTEQILTAGAAAAKGVNDTVVAAGAEVVNQVTQGIDTAQLAAQVANVMGKFYGATTQVHTLASANSMPIIEYGGKSYMAVHFRREGCEICTMELLPTDIVAVLAKVLAGQSKEAHAGAQELGKMFLPRDLPMSSLLGSGGGAESEATPQPPLIGAAAEEGEGQEEEEEES
jgi:hypothetical protein